MALVSRVDANTYQDSIRLMRLSERLSRLDGVQQAIVAMGTEANKHVLAEAGLLTEAIEAAGPNDLVIAIDAHSDDVAQHALAELDTLLAEAPGVPEGYAGDASSPEFPRVRTLEQAPGDANLAMISVAGQYAALEAAKALRAGLHVFLFSNNVPLEEELELKRWAVDRGVLLMGPDCGTAIINGTALAFANVVRRGPIGLVAASGTGLQEVTCLVDRGGSGVSQAIGIGGRDLSETVGGLMAKQGLAMLADDPDTEVIVLISKPPAQNVADALVEEVRRIEKPVVVNFLGSSRSGRENGVTFAVTLEETATAALRLAGLDGAAPFDLNERALAAMAESERRRLGAGQRYLRGLFSGGTLCDEAMVILAGHLPAVYSNIPLRPAWQLDDSWQSREHSCIDLGGNEFTQGRPHPMLDPRLRRERLLKEAGDSAVAVILLDIVLGYGSHEDPAGALAGAIRTVKEQAASNGRYLAVVTHVCGTQEDPQGLTRQEEVLREAGALVLPTNAQAARVAAAIVEQG